MAGSTTLQTPATPSRFPVRLATLVLLVLAVAAAAGWLLITKTAGHDTLVATGDVRKNQVSALNETLIRYSTEGEGIDLAVLLGTPDFFRMTGRAQDGTRLGTDRGLLFVANDDTHYRDLPNLVVRLRVDGATTYAPSESTTLADASHHRTTAWLFTELQPATLAAEHTLELIVDGGEGPAVLSWTTPIAYPDVVQGGGIDLRLILPLAAGLLAAISPCLLQLTAFYLPTLAGLTVAEGGAIDRRRMVPFAALFVLGFTVPYTIGGAVLGAVGGAAAVAGILDPTGPVAIGAGVVMIVMAVLVARQARAPLVCRMPMPALISRSRRFPFVEAFASGFAIATGCLACFGGAILGVLIVYTGILGSPLLGGIAMFTFSLGIAIPFLLAAFGLSKVKPLFELAARATPAVGLVMAAVMLFFGVTMATGNFHVLSGWLYQHLPLG